MSTVAAPFQDCLPGAVRYSASPSPWASEVATNGLFTLQVRKRRHREVKSLAQGHTARKSEGFKPRPWDFSQSPTSPVLITIYHRGQQITAPGENPPVFQQPVR